MLRSILIHCPEHPKAQAGRPWASFLEAHMHQFDYYNNRAYNGKLLGSSVIVLTSFCFVDARASKSILA